MAIADRFSPRLVFLICSVLGAATTLALLVVPEGLTGLLILRFATGFFLAGIYPVGMKIAASWYENGLGRALGYLTAVLLGGIGMWFGYRLVNWPKFADFLISVEAELNKVSWPTQKELVRASLVVIFTILFLSVILLAYEALWEFLFGMLGIN